MTLLVLGLNGSPRRHGNSETLLQEALRGAEEEGASLLRLDLAFLDVAPCRACEDCFRDGECVLLDDMRHVYEALERADAVIVASPIYFSGMSSQTKVAVDRCQALWARRHLLERPRKAGAAGIILVAAQPQAKFENAASELRAFLTGIGIRPVRTLTVGGLERRTSAAERPDAMAQAHQLGRKVVQALSAGP